ncbi:MAG: PEP-CTERM sorting domain-containing protein [Verrucomicrobia bacterium]|nr:PEP-CTERM sorting domain-containing protein [Verrucomicrobiota bacterium]
MIHSTRSLFAGALLLALSSQFTVAAEIVYENASNDLNTNLDPGTREVGDEIILDGTARWLSEFTFEYWGTNTLSDTEFAGTVEARIRFYLNDGPPLPSIDDVLTPGTLLYDSGSFQVDPTPRATLVFTDFNLGNVPLTQPLPDSFTWSVQFSGLGLTDTAGVTIYSPPTIGNNFDDYWVNDGVNWLLETNLVNMDFAARFAAVPEPSTLLLGLLGLAVVSGVRRWTVKR